MEADCSGLSQGNLFRSKGGNTMSPSHFKTWTWVAGRMGVLMILRLFGY